MTERIDEIFRWDERFSTPGFLFGTEPAAFVATHAGLLRPGQRALVVADGEGRNGVYLAELGLQVTAFDASSVGVAKAVDLAARRGVSMRIELSGVETWDWTTGYDAVVAVFVQFAPPELRDRMFGWMIGALRPGGLLLLHGYTPRQVTYGTGGPPSAAHMYTAELLAQAFAGHEILELEEYEADLDEGTAHRGRSALIDCVVRRR